MSCKHDMKPYEARTIVVTVNALEFACTFCEIESMRAELENTSDRHAALPTLGVATVATVVAQGMR